MSKGPQVHWLKTLPEFFKMVVTDVKTFEIRRNDRGFKVGDYLSLQEFAQDRFTGRKCLVIVTYLTDWDQKPGTVVMGLF